MPLSLMTRLFFHSMVITILFAVMVLVRKLCKRQLTMQAQYNLWFLFLFVLFLPFIPRTFLLPDFMDNILKNLGKSLRADSQSAWSSASELIGGRAGESSLLQDFAVSSSGMAPAYFSRVFIDLWIAGMIFMTGLTIRSSLKIARIKKASLPLQNQQLQALFSSCLKEAGVKRNIPVYSSMYISSPMAAGLFFPCILIPVSMISELTEKEIRFIFLHELLHYKNKDLFTGKFMALAQIVYWFHPIVWIALSEMQNDREMACDSAVLSLIEPESYLDYGHTLINFAERLSQFSYSATGIGGSKKEIKKRILNIAGFCGETRRLRQKSKLIFAFISILVIGFTPSLSAGAYSDETYEFSSEHTQTLDPGSCFEGYDGSFVLYEINADQFYIYNQKNCSTRFSPDSTYKIYSALAALEEGVITEKSSVLTWDHTLQPFAEWNQDQTLKSAMTHSVNWYFQTLDQQTGADKLQKYFHSIHYGNEDFSGGLSRYWMESSLKISPLEQVALLTGLCKETLPFQKEHMKEVKNSLLLSSSNGSSLYGKTGTGKVDGKNTNGWFIGFVESKTETYVFAANLQGDDDAKGSAAFEITKDILRDKNIYK